MNFSDDPLADLFSDNSIDNDNFFDNAPGRKARTNASKNKSKLDDLFGIREEKENETPLGGRKQTASAISKPTPRITTQQPTQSKSDTIDDDDDDLGFDPLKPKTVGKLNLFDDLLGAGAETKRPATALPSTRREPEKLVISRQSTDTTTDTSQPRPKTSVGRRSSGASGVGNTNIDPLGLFGGAGREREKEKDLNATSTSDMSTPSTRKRGTTADWLGLSVEPEVGVGAGSRVEMQPPQSPQRIAKPPTTPINAAATAKETVEILKLPDTAEHFSGAATVDVPEVLMTPRPATGNSTAQNILLLNTHNMEMKNAYTALQQQESQLVLAAQMKNQERALVEMQRKQETLLQHQERQFQALLQQQLQRQQNMEEHIKMQQQRINTHLQLLMTQPVMLPPLPMAEAVASDGDAGGVMSQKVDEVATSHDTHNTNQHYMQSQGRSRSQSRSRASSPQETMLDMVQLEADVKRLELEKLRLEELVESMKTNNDREVELIEQSYKKQLKVWEEQSLAVETRLRTELEDITKYYTQKLDVLESERQKLKAEMDNEIGTLKQDHEDEQRKLKKAHEDDLEMLKEEHRRMLENVRQAKMLEFAAVQENGSYLETLKLASSNLENLSGGLQGLRDDMQTKLEMLNKEKEKKLEARERKLEDAERRLQISDEANEEEKKRLMALVSSLEQKLSKLSKDSGEENWVLRQRMSTLEAEKLAFEREKEFTREQLMRDEQRLADLKEQQLAESQRALLELQEERARLYVERTKIETERKLHPDNDMEGQRLEMEAVMQVAQDATRQADAERGRYNKLMRQLEQQRRELIDKEDMLRAKEDELEQELISFRMAEHKSQEAQQKARVAEQNFHMKIQYLQQRMRETGEKEVQLSQERLMVTQERIALQQWKLQLAERRCELCKMGQERMKIVQMLSEPNGVNGAAIAAGAGGATGNSVNGSASRLTVADNGDERKLRQVMEQGNLVERMLDENIAQSYRKMKATTTMGETYWSESVLDDDAKEFALNNLDPELLNDINALLEDQTINTYQ